MAQKPDVDAEHPMVRHAVERINDLVAAELDVLQQIEDAEDHLLTLKHLSNITSTSREEYEEGMRVMGMDEEYIELVRDEAEVRWNNEHSKYGKNKTPKKVAR